MKFFIVDNGSRYLENIVLRITSEGHSFHIQTYSPFEKLDPQDADVILLSGGMQNEVADDLKNGDPWYRHEFELIRDTELPVFGICLGLQMITAALGGTLKKLPEKIVQDTEVHLTEAGHRYLGHRSITVHEKHQWGVDSYAGTGLKLLATSNDGIEILMHPSRHIIGTQFHPEVDIDHTSKQLFWDILNLVTQPAKVTHA
jgi:GMP synthase-like glutamine amidotransferase